MTLPRGPPHWTDRDLSGHATAPLPYIHENSTEVAGVLTTARHHQAGRSIGVGSVGIRMIW